MFEELSQVFAECHESNWDDFSALPVSDETYRLAFQFLEGLSLDTPTPSVSAEPDGHLTFEWYRSPRQTLSVSVSPDGDLNYAALIGSEKACGTEPFFGGTPKAVDTLIQKVTNA